MPMTLKRLIYFELYRVSLKKCPWVIETVVRHIIFNNQRTFFLGHPVMYFDSN